MKFKDTQYGDLTDTYFDSSVYLTGAELTSLEGAPKVIAGRFTCANNNLTSLEGAPEEILGLFTCAGNNLTNLKGGPKKVKGNYNCHNNELTSLEGCPIVVGGIFSCGDNKLTSLRGISLEIESVVCINNPNPHLEQEWEIRKGNPEMTEKEINEKMFELTESEFYIDEEVKKTFLF